LKTESDFEARETSERRSSMTATTVPLLARHEGAFDH
jgi:hypothetical protein